MNAPIENLKEVFGWLREEHRHRTDLLNAQTRLTLQIRAICSRCVIPELQAAGEIPSGGLLTAKEWIKIKAASAKLYKAMTPEVLALCQPLLSARDVIHREILKCDSFIEKTLHPAIPSGIRTWAEGVRGLGKISLVQILGESGDPRRFPVPAKLWKRMGLAVINGEAQRKCLDPEKALRHGYSPKRRSIMHVVGENLIKANNPEYRALYNEIKARKFAELPAEAKGRKGHAHRMALRYIEKRLLRDLWISAKG